DLSDIGVLLQNRPVEWCDDARVVHCDLGLFEGELGSIDAGDDPFVVRFSNSYSDRGTKSRARRTLWRSRDCFASLRSASAIRKFSRALCKLAATTESSRRAIT